MTTHNSALAQDVSAPSPAEVFLKRVLEHRGLMIGATVLILIVLCAVSAPLLTTHDPYQQTLSDRMTPPVWNDRGSWEHVLGTDHLGRDYLARLMYGARISLTIGFGTAIISGLIGTFLGVAAGYFGRYVDMIVTFLISIRLSMPVVLVALATVALVGGSLQVVILVLGFLLWDRFAVVMRASTLQIRNLDYVVSAQAAGCSVARIVFTEIMPNVVNNLIVVATLEMAHAVILEAALSFLGLGVQPPLPSWGLMISEGKEMMFFDPYLISVPGAALFALVLSINLLGDGIRDVTAP
jgi:peptide/nickel transport system permease protein